MTGGQRQGTDRDLQQGGVDGQPEGQRLGVLSVELLERRHQGHAQLVGLEHCVSEQTGRSAGPAHSSTAYTRDGETLSTD